MPESTEAARFRSARVTEPGRSPSCSIGSWLTPYILMAFRPIRCSNSCETRCALKGRGGHSSLNNQLAEYRAQRCMPFLQRYLILVGQNDACLLQPLLQLHHNGGLALDLLQFGRHFVNLVHEEQLEMHRMMASILLPPCFLHLRFATQRLGVEFQPARVQLAIFSLPSGCEGTAQLFDVSVDVQVRLA